MDKQDETQSDFVTFVVDSGALAHSALQHPYWQQHPQLNRSLLLFMVWYGESQRGRLSRAQVQELIAEVQLWHDRVSQSLRRFSDSIDGTHSLAPEVEDTLRVAEELECAFLRDSKPAQAEAYRPRRFVLRDIMQNCSLYFSVLRLPAGDGQEQAVCQLIDALLSTEHDELSASWQKAAASANKKGSAAEQQTQLVF